MTTVLIVDDELDMRLLVRTIIELSSHGLVVAGEATDGREALEVGKSSTARRCRTS